MDKPSCKHWLQTQCQLYTKKTPIKTILQEKKNKNKKKQKKKKTKTIQTYPNFQFVLPISLT